MMDEQQKTQKKAAKPKAWLATTFLLMVFFCVTSPTHAAPAEIKQSKNVKILQYKWDRSTPEYKMAWEGMNEIYKKTVSDFESQYPFQPSIFYASHDLNNDGTEELIAYPLWQNDEMIGACKPLSTKCPHFILDIRDGKPHVIGQIMANSVDVSTQKVNGYYVLNAYSFEDDAMLEPKKFSYYLSYEYALDKKIYRASGHKPKKDNGSK